MYNFIEEGIGLLKLMRRNKMLYDPVALPIVILEYFAKVKGLSMWTPRYLIEVELGCL